MEDFEIILDGDFGFEITYANYVRMLADANGRKLHHKINSSGGDVTEMTAMRNALETYLRKYNTTATMEVVGWVQSAATYFMMVPGVRVIVNADSLFMYHNPASVAVGDHRAMAKKTAFLSDLADVYAKSYAVRSGKAIEQVRTEMDAETYFIGQAIVDNGFADAVEGEQDRAHMRAESVVVEMGRNRFKQTVGRLAAAAYGGPLQPVTAGKQPDRQNNITTGETEMSEPTTKETQKPDVSGETARAEAWMVAVDANPALKAVLAAKFKEGASVEFFQGVAAAVEMTAAAKSHDEAQKENVAPITPGEIKPEPANGVMSAGMTGEVLEVR